MPDLFKDFPMRAFFLSLTLLLTSPLAFAGTDATPKGAMPAKLVSAKVNPSSGFFTSPSVELTYQGEPGRHVCVLLAMAVTTQNQTSLKDPRDGRASYGSLQCVDLGDDGRGTVAQAVNQTSGVLLATVQFSLVSFHLDAVNLAHPEQVIRANDAERSF
jgi:hypothetical protein